MLQLLGLSEVLCDNLGDFVIFYKLVRFQLLGLDLRVTVFVLSFVFLPLLVLFQHFLLKVGPESAVTKGHQGLAVEVGHHLKHGVVVSPVCVVKTVLKLGQFKSNVSS